MPDIRLPPVGRCIYCNADESSVPLTDEHIIPLALNGHIILQKASCKPCAAATSAVERYCLREMLIEARVHLNMRTRRPKNRPTALPIYFNRPKGKEKNELPIDEHPLVLRLPRLRRAPILTGRQGSEWVEHLDPPFWTFVGFPEGTGDVRERVDALGESATDFSYSPTQFCLMLAKIAHAATVAHLGYGSFEPLLNRFIIEKSTEVHDYVGGQPNPPSINRETSFHVVIRKGAKYILAYLCPFAHLGAPVYEVVVGRPL